jgi:hypothetical protein
MVSVGERSYYDRIHYHKRNNERRLVENQFIIIKFCKMLMFLIFCIILDEKIRIRVFKMQIDSNILTME